MPPLDDADRRLLDQLQTSVPLTPEPYAELGATLDMEAGEVRSRIDALREAHLIRQISAIFDSRKLGYQSSLVAFAVEPERLEGVAHAVSDHEGVSHNYERDFSFNLWFTIAVPPGGDLPAEVASLARTPGVTRAHVLPTERVFKVGVQLGMDDGSETAARSQAPEPQSVREHAPPTEDEIEAIRVLQRDLPAVERPFAELAAPAGMDEASVLQYGETFLADGRMRRFAAVLHHRDAGFVHNAMVMWRAEDERVAEVGKVMASFDGVSHCYQRPSYEDLPYNLYTMIHGRREDECDEVVRAIASATGVEEYHLVYSTREFKKVRVRYFEEAQRPGI